MYAEETGRRGNGQVSAVCIKWTNAAGDREVSIAANDSAGALSTMGRCDIRCYQSGKDHNFEVDVTGLVFLTGDTIGATNANVRKALEWLGD